MMLDLEPLRRKVEQREGLPRGTLSALATVESSNNPQAVSPKGALGLYQIMPGTAEDLGIDPLDPVQATEGAGRYLGWLVRRTGTLEGGLAAYNGGIGNLERKGMEGMPAETQQHVPKVLGLLGRQPAQEPAQEAQMPTGTTGLLASSALPQQASEGLEWGPDATTLGLLVSHLKRQRQRRQKRAPEETGAKLG